jgi:hypothetical protein
MVGTWLDRLVRLWLPGAAWEAQRAGQHTTPACRTGRRAWQDYLAVA